MSHRPRKRFGQNYLHGGLRVMCAFRLICSDADVGPTSTTGRFWR